MVVNEKIYFEAYTNDQYIWHKNNVAQLYFILGWKFSSWLRDAPDIYKFPTVHMVKTHFLLKNLRLSGASFSMLEKFQHSSAVPSVKDNCGVIFLCQMYWSLTCFKIYFLIDQHGKTPRKRKNLLNFLQGDNSMSFQNRSTTEIHLHSHTIFWLCHN